MIAMMGNAMIYGMIFEMILGCLEYERCAAGWHNGDHSFPKASLLAEWFND